MKLEKVMKKRAEKPYVDAQINDSMIPLSRQASAQKQKEGGKEVLNPCTRGLHRDGYSYDHPSARSIYFDHFGREAEKHFQQFSG